MPWVSLIPKLLHTLRYLKNKSYLNDFWISIVKIYSISKLSKEQIEWIIKAKVNDNFTNKEIEDVQSIYQLAECNSFIESTEVES